MYDISWHPTCRTDINYQGDSKCGITRVQTCSIFFHKNRFSDGLCKKMICQRYQRRCAGKSSDAKKREIETTYLIALHTSSLSTVFY